MNGGYVLTNSGRYAHRLDYVEESTEAAGFVIWAVEEATLRIEMDKPVAGLLIVARLQNVAGT